MNATTVTFYSQATGNPTHYSWAFDPPAVTFTDTSGSSSLNPRVIFNAVANYTVSLTLTGEGGTKTTTKTDYIHVNEANANFTSPATTVVVNNYTTLIDASTCNATAWRWNFGEGASPASANTQGPHSVSYNTAGFKTVSLSVNGNTTLSKTGYINVIEPAINMSTANVSACSGTFYDSGGPSSNYVSNQDFTMLFYPGIPGNKLQFDFTSFDIEAQATCTKDYLKIYDGTTKLSPLLGTFCGTGSPGIVKATSTSGALLFVFHSNTVITQPGWSATISCIPNRAMNPVSFTALPVSSSQVSLEWAKNPDNNNVILAWSPNGSFGNPVDGTAYIIGEAIPGGGTILANGGETTFNHSGLNAATTYFYKVFSYGADVAYSTGITADVATLQPTVLVPEKGLKGIRIFPNPAEGQFRIVVDKSKYPAMQVTITNTDGAFVTSRLCKDESEYFFDLSRSPKGTYILKIDTGKELLIAKLVIIK